MGAVLSATNHPEASSHRDVIPTSERNNHTQHPVVAATTSTTTTATTATAPTASQVIQRDEDANIETNDRDNNDNNDNDNNNNSNGAPKMSKNKMKRLAKEEKWRVLKKARRAEKKAAKASRLAEKRAERAAAFAALSPEERKELQRARTDAMKQGRVDGRQRRSEVRRVISECTTYGIAIDLAWTGDMYPKELRSLARQLSYSYSILRKGVEGGMQPVSLSLYNLDDTMRGELAAAASGWDVWPVNFHSGDLNIGEDRTNLVYLTHDSENVITELDPHATYVIGGIVDRNRLKGATARKAENLGIPTARFNLDEVISLQKGTRVLTVNHCVDILLQVRNGKSWTDAYLNVLPERKGLAKEEKEEKDIDTVLQPEKEDLVETDVAMTTTIGMQEDAVSKV